MPLTPEQAEAMRAEVAAYDREQAEAQLAAEIAQYAPILDWVNSPAFVEICDSLNAVTAASVGTPAAPFANAMGAGITGLRQFAAKYAQAEPPAP